MAGIPPWLFHQPPAQVTERMREQAGHVHLRDAELLADLRLRHVTGEAHQQDALLAPGQLVPVRRDGLHVQCVLHRRVLVAEHISQPGGVRPVAERRVQGERLEDLLGTPRGPQLLAGRAEMLAQVSLVRRPAELLGELAAAG